jgi:hypothetical protein
MRKDWARRAVVWLVLCYRDGCGNDRSTGVSQERFGDLASLTTVTLPRPPIRAAVGSTNSRGALRLLHAVPPTS